MTDPGQVREEAEAGGGVQAQGGVQAGEERLLSESGEDGLQSRGRSGEDQTDSLQWNHRTMRSALHRPQEQIKQSVDRRQDILFSSSPIFLLLGFPRCKILSTLSSHNSQ